MGTDQDGTWLQTTAVYFLSLQAQLGQLQAEGSEVVHLTSEGAGCLDGELYALHNVINHADHCECG